MPAKTILITGGRGLVGRHLAKALEAKGYRVAVLTRSLAPGRREERAGRFFYGWTHEQMPEEAVLEADAVVHLAGANIFDRRWTPARKQLIIASRVKPSLQLAEILRRRGKKLEAYVSASAVGYYGMITSEEIFTEEHPPADDFTGLTGRLWEEAADEVARLGIRTVKLRTGIALAQDGGALRKMLPAFRLGLGAPIGSGRQYFPWIHIRDLTGMYLLALESEGLEGAYNAAVQSDTTSRLFGAVLAKVLRRPYFMPAIPGSLLHLILGERAQLLLEGSRVSAEKIKKAGFVFDFEELSLGLEDLICM